MGYNVLSTSMSVVKRPPTRTGSDEAQNALMTPHTQATPTSFLMSRRAGAWPSCTNAAGRKACAQAPSASPAPQKSSSSWKRIWCAARATVPRPAAASVREFTKIIFPSSATKTGTATARKRRLARSVGIARLRLRSTRTPKGPPSLHSASSFRRLRNFSRMNAVESAWAITVAAAAPATPKGGTSRASPIMLAKPLMRTTSTGVTESRSPRHTAWAAAVNSASGAPIARTRTYARAGSATACSMPKAGSAIGAVTARNRPRMMPVIRLIASPSETTSCAATRWPTARREA
mmetsp:Transcript_94732/g.244635  ORF Transcript_94732/g.244635 Transcript_94732/m.244635 type:complete len:291 (-) Transcript_94732:266-1138(-)